MPASWLHLLAGHTDMNTTKWYVHASDADFWKHWRRCRVRTKLSAIPETPNPRMRRKYPQFSECEGV